MRKLIFILIVANILLVNSISTAHDNVVVIPLGKSASNTQYDELWPVYDSSDTFVGYFLDMDPEGYFDHELIISPQGYFAPYEAGHIFSLCLGYFPNNTYNTYYETSDCTGQPYYVFEEGNNVLWGPAGVVGTACNSSTMYYIPKGASPVTLPIGSWRVPDCTSFSSPIPISVYQSLPNDPTITGFQNTYDWPLKTVVTVPPAP